MAKTYLDSVKYVIEISFEISGAVEKPDIIGAIFGQSEGLLGEEMDLRELQKGGRLGRIEIQMESKEGKTSGKIIIPSSMDMVETSLLAAAIESVDKVGPFDAKMQTQKIEDIRDAKRKEISSRAKELLNKFLKQQMPQAQDIAEEVRENARSAELEEYGLDKLPAGPNIEAEESIIVVEGRADVINLLKNNVKNVIGMGGAQISPTIMELCRKKTVTLFIDGDRGGELNLKKLQQLAPVAFIARAPEGKEVEELTRKEIVMALRKKVSAEAVPERREFGRPQRKGFYQKRPSFGASRERGFGRERGTGFGYRAGPRRDGFRRPGPRIFREEFEEREEPASKEELEQFKPVMDNLKGTLKAKLFNEKMEEIKEIPVRELVEELQKTKGIQAVVFDGIVTKRVVEEAKNAGIKTLVGVKKEKIEKQKDTRVVTIAE